jgi:hypothetical protein
VLAERYATQGGKPVRATDLHVLDRTAKKFRITVRDYNYTHHNADYRESQWLQAIKKSQREILPDYDYTTVRRFFEQ